MRARLAQDHATGLPPSPGKVRLRGLAGLSEFVQHAEPELAANAMLCAANQAAYLLKRQLESQGQTFLNSGGFTEKLYGARSQVRKSEKSEKPPAPYAASPCSSAPRAKARGQANRSGAALAIRIARVRCQTRLT